MARFCALVAKSAIIRFCALCSARSDLVELRIPLHRRGEREICESAENRFLQMLIRARASRIVGEHRDEDPPVDSPGQHPSTPPRDASSRGSRGDTASASRSGRLPCRPADWWRRRRHRGWRSRQFVVPPPATPTIFLTSRFGRKGTSGSRANRSSGTSWARMRAA